MEKNDIRVINEIHKYKQVLVKFSNLETGKKLINY